MSADRDVADQHACTEAVLDITPDAPIVANLGTSSWVLADVDDRDRNFYMRGGMGSTTPTGFGVALGVDSHVTVLEGDGSLLMSLGSLSTIGQYDPSNLTIVVFNNAVFATTGGQPTLAETTDFAGVAEDCGLVGYSVNSASDFEAAYEEAVAHDGATLIEVAVDSVDPGRPPNYDYGHSYLQHRFRTAVAGTPE